MLDNPQTRPGRFRGEKLPLKGCFKNRGLVPCSNQGLNRPTPKENNSWWFEPWLELGAKGFSGYLIEGYGFCPSLEGGIAQPLFKPPCGA